MKPLVDGASWHGDPNTNLRFLLLSWMLLAAPTPPVATTVVRTTHTPAHPHTRASGATVGAGIDNARVKNKPPIAIPARAGDVLDQ